MTATEKESTSTPHAVPYMRSCREAARKDKSGACGLDTNFHHSQARCVNVNMCLIIENDELQKQIAQKRQADVRLKNLPLVSKKDLSGASFQNSRFAFFCKMEKNPKTEI